MPDTATAIKGTNLSEGQIRECSEYAERNGITVLSSYIDRALSAPTAPAAPAAESLPAPAKAEFDDGFGKY